MAKETEELVLDEDQEQETPAEPETPETPEPESPEEPEAEETEGEGTVEEAESVVPTMVRQYMPAVADKWESYSEEQRSTVLDDLERAIDLGEPAGEGDGKEAEKGKAKEPAKAPAAEPDAGAQAASLEKPPEPITDEELRTATEYLDDTEGHVSVLLKKMLALVNYAVQGTEKVGGQALEMVRETRGDIISIKEERQIQTAIESHAPELRDLDLTREQYDQVVEAGVQYQRTGRTGDFHDGISLALRNFQKGRLKTKAKPSGAAKEEAAKLAATIARGGRPGRRKAPAKSGEKTISGIFQYHNRRLRGQK